MSCPALSSVDVVERGMVFPDQRLSNAQRPKPPKPHPLKRARTTLFSSFRRQKDGKVSKKSDTFRRSVSGFFSRFKRGNLSSRPKLKRANTEVLFGAKPTPQLCPQRPTIIDTHSRKPTFQRARTDPAQSQPRVLKRSRTGLIQTGQTSPQYVHKFDSRKQNIVSPRHTVVPLLQARRYNPQLERSKSGLVAPTPIRSQR
eukprot:1034_1